MIERMQIVNFQKHEKFRVIFDEKITTIVGPSDTGKSSILRALRWVAFNRPLGDGFVHHEKDRCSVKVWVNGRRIERRKTKRENCYLVDGKKLSAVGTEVPEEVQRLLNVTPENFQGQHDPPFWFSMTAGEVAKRLNAIVDLEVIDRSASWLLSNLRKTRTEQDVIARRLKEAEDEADKLSYVEDLVEDFERVRDQQRQASRIYKEAAALSEFVETACQGAARARTLRQAASGASDLANQLESLHGISEALERLRESMHKVQQAANNVVQLNQHVKEAREELDRRTEGTCPLCGGRWK